MRINITRRLAATIVVPVALLGLTACNDDNDDASGSDKTDETTSQETTTDEGSGDETETDSGDTADGEQISNEEFAQLVENGIEKTTTARMTMKIDASGMETTAEGVMDYTGDTPATQMTMTMPGGAGAPAGGEMEVIMVDGVIYMSMPGMTEAGSYLKVDPKTNPEFAGQMDQLDSFDMSNMAKSFSEGLESVETVGSEEIDGVETTQYAVEVNTKEAQAMLGNVEGAEVPDNIAYDVWLDSEGRIIQMQMDMGATGSMTMNTTDHGADVSVTAPPADKVQDMAEMMKGMGEQ